jgi:hypothetical protein
MVSIADSVFPRFAPLHPIPIFAAWAGTTARATAAITAAPSNFLTIVIFLLFSKAGPAALPESAK